MKRVPHYPPSSRLMVPSQGQSREDRFSVLERFASLLGTKGAHQDIVSASTRMKELSRLLSPTTVDVDVVLNVPSLDLRLVDDEKSKSELFPEVGTHAASNSAAAVPVEHSSSFSASTAAANTASLQEGPRPDMAASVLALASDHQTVIELEAAQNIGKPTAWTRSTVGYASGAVGLNISDSFTTLLNSRLRAWTLLLLRHSLSTGSGESRSRVLNMLAADIQVKSIETDFKTLPLPDAAKGAKPRDSDIILPLLFQVTLRTTIQNNPESVLLRAPGTISGKILFRGVACCTDDETVFTHYFSYNFSSPAIFDHGIGLKKVCVELDTKVVLKSMLDQARIAVLKAVASATNTTVPSASVLSKTHPIAKRNLSTTTSVQTLSTLNSSSSTAGAFSSTLRSGILSPIYESKRLDKAQTTAYLLNSVLHGRSSAGDRNDNNIQNSRPDVAGMRPVRSVRFDQMTQAPKLTSEVALPNKKRMAQTANKLKSFKSFGRPHAGDYGTGPGNATFGEFGTAGAWGRDGRLAAHPTPGQASAFDAMNNMSGGSTDKNATFDNILSNSNATQSNQDNPFLARTGGLKRSAAAVSGAALLGRSSGSSPSGSMPRTATVLENMLIQKWA